MALPFPSVGVKVQLQSLTLKRPEFDLKSQLLKSTLLPWAPVAINSADARPEIEREAPIAEDVVAWMHVAASDIAVFDGMCEEYNRLGSELLSGSGDGYIPGVRVGDCRAVSVNGYTIRSRGYGTVSTPRGDFNVPVRGKATFAKNDILAWAALPNPGTGIQWVLTLLQWKDLARIPVSNRVRFGSSNGLVAPNFFSASPRAPVPLVTYIIGITSDKPQTITFRGRGTKGSYENVLFEESFNVEAGESEIIYNVLGFPFSPAFTMELQPSDNTSTILDYIKCFP